MTQRSRPQADNNATLAYIDSGPYSADQWAERVYSVHTGDENTTGQRARLRGVVPTFDDLLVVTNPGDEIWVGTGAGMALGHMLFNNAVVEFTPTPPVANPRIDLVCIVENNTNAAVGDGTAANGWIFPADLTDYDATPGIGPYSARLVIVKGAEAAVPAEPALDVSNTLFMVAIAKYELSVAGAFSGFVDRREFIDIEKIVGVNDADNDTIEDALIIGTQVTDGAGDDGLGVAIRARLENDNGDLEDAGQVAIRWTDATNGSEDARLELRLAAGNADNLSGVINAPTAASADGNARGVGSVDFQQIRNAATQVASGIYSVISGGRHCTASGAYSTVAGGQSCVASGDNSFAAGAAEATGDYSMATGYDTYATEDYSVALGGETISNLYGQVAHAAGRFAVNGDAQGTIQLVARTTTAGGSAATTLYLDNNIELPIIPASTGWTYDILIVAISTTAVTHYAAFRAYGMIERDNANNTTLHSVTGVITEAASGGQTATVTADDANEALLIQFDDNGTAAHRVVATIRLAQVTFP